jgi:site-specific recombinase XerD
MEGGRFFLNERGLLFSTAGFAQMIERASVEADFDFEPHPPILRHAFALANAGRDTCAL